MAWFYAVTVWLSALFRHSSRSPPCLDALQRQGHKKAGAFASDAATLYPDPAVHGLDQLATEVETQAVSGLRASFCRWQAGEFGEEEWLFDWCDSRPPIAHRQHDKKARCSAGRLWRAPALHGPLAHLFRVCIFSAERDTRA